MTDLKAGIAFSGPTSDHTDQLLLYCGLVWSLTGVMPTEAVILGVAQDEHLVEVSEAEVERVRQSAVEHLTEFNELATGDCMPIESAEPSADSCRWCPFRVVCDAFIDQASPDWAAGAFLLGEVQAISGQGRPDHVVVRVEKPDWLRGVNRLINFPFPSSIETGERWAAIDYKGQAHTSSALWNTTVARW